MTREAIIVAGGFGTRLLPLTTHTPKHLLNVGGVPFLAHQLAKLGDAGIDHVVLATSYRAEAFVPVFGDGSQFGLRLTYVREDEPLGTGGALRNVVPALSADPEAPIVILNGDVLSGHDLGGQLVDFDRPRGGRPVDVSLHLVEVEDARAFGCVPTDDEGRVLEFVEKSDNPVTRQINAGCYVFRRGVLDTIPEGRVVSVERETFPGLIADGAVVVGYVENAYWRDVGTPEALVAASRDAVLGIAPRYDGVGAAECFVAPGAQILGSVSGGSIVEADAVIGSSANVVGSIVMTGARIGEGAVVRNSVVGPGAEVGAGVVIDAVTLGDGARLLSGAPTGSRIDCGAVV